MPKVMTFQGQAWLVRSEMSGANVTPTEPSVSVSALAGTRELAIRHERAVCIAQEHKTEHCLGTPEQRALLNAT